MESEHAGPDHHQDSLAHTQPLDASGKKDIIDFRDKMREMREYFLYGVDSKKITEPDLAEFDQNLRDFHRKIDEWQNKNYGIKRVLNTPDEVVNIIRDAEKLLHRARSLLKRKKLTEREDDELFDKYTLLGTKAGEIVGKICL